MARHAGARSCSVEVTVDGLGRRLNLVVRDDGSGPPPGGPGRVSGLANLAARAARRGGGCVLVAAGGGCRLDWTAELPARTGGQGSGR
ncbi:hypothetical protein [Amycolatopsis australiensis]|uniref:hypothetical protein n=1 Tax=Amycolatopsis australiensis TaxID=546364 RepID=UPI001FE60220|nr:hypothetical protein [Amycolatopsis australiensis]